MLQPLYLDGITYKREEIKHLASDVAAVRDAALETNQFHYAISLSKVHALLQHLHDNTEN